MQYPEVKTGKKEKVNMRKIVTRLIQRVCMYAKTRILYAKLAHKLVSIKYASAILKNSAKLKYLTGC